VCDGAKSGLLFVGRLRLSGDKLHLKISRRGVSMEPTITVPDKTKSAFEQRARERGYSDVSKYVERLTSTDLLAAKSFDEILAPIRKTFQESGASDADLEVLFEEACEVVKHSEFRREVR
jgi:hypothetical protein